MRRPDALSDAALARTTPVPNVLIDALLPHLSDTELRVLLVVDRATLGWKQGSGRKKSDWLSHRQLQARTGRAGASVSHAVERLVRRGLLIVEDGNGQARDSAASRRAVRGRLYFRLSDALLRPALDGSSTVAPEASEVACLEGTQRRGEEAQGKNLQEPVSSSALRVQKVKTTKETGTKEKEDKMSSSESEVHFLNSSGAERKEAIQNSSVDDLEDQAERFVNVFTHAYRLARPGEAVPPIEAAERTLLLRFLRQPGPAVLEAWLPAFFASSFGYARRRGWSLGCYLNCFFILQAQAGSNPLRKGAWQRAAGDNSG